MRSARRWLASRSRNRLASARWRTKRPVSGKAEDKREKNRFAAEDVWNYFKKLKTVGVVSDDGCCRDRIPRGVVAAIIPSTNPTSTAIFKIIIAIKSRNTIVLSPHPSAANCIAETTRIMRDGAVALGLPAEAIICLTNSTVEGTESLMKNRKTAVILATGGTGLVRAAYSSGKPAFGVGPRQCAGLYRASADVEKAVADILTGTCFDNGTICASEQSVIADAPVAAQVREQFERQGGHFLNATEADAVAKVLLTPQRTLNAGIVGKSAKYIADLAGISIPGRDPMLACRLRWGWPGPSMVDREALAHARISLSRMASRPGLIAAKKSCSSAAWAHGGNAHAGPRCGDPLRCSDAGRARVGHQSPTTHGAIGFSTDLPPR
jgi:acyl-CoA reductase-like NAD-dependent aldehyde dehydrogenase